MYARVATFVGRDKRVLTLGRAAGILLRLRDQGCRIVAVEADPDVAARASADCERVIVGDVDQLDLARELDQDRFDVAVAIGFLECLKDPLSALSTIRRYLRQDGYLVASVPNIAHGSIRLALLSGSFPSGDGGPLDRAQVRFYTRETLEKLFEEAEFAIGRLERQQVSIEAPSMPVDRDLIPSSLVETLARDPEALTCRFTVVAYPMPRPELRFIQRRILELARESDAAQGRIRELTAENAAGELALAEVRQVAEEQKAQLDALTGRVELMTGREAELRQILLETRDLLTRRDEDVDLLKKAVGQHLATIHELRGQLEASGDRLEGARAELGVRDDQDPQGRIDAKRARPGWRAVRSWLRRFRVK